MKTLTSTILALLLSSFAYSQVSYPIPQDNTSEWRIWRSTWDPLTSIVQSSDFKVFVSGDTIINGNEYSRLLCSGIKSYEYQGNSNSWSFENEFYTFIRSDSAHVYCYNYNQEQLLFDYTLQPGDALPETMINGSTVIVSSIDSVIVNGKYLKRFNIYDPVNDDLVSNWYIEGLGHETGLIEPMYMMFDNGWYLECYAENGLSVFPEGSECDLEVNIKENLTDDYSASVYPNPSQGVFTLAYLSEGAEDAQVKVVGVLGNVIINDIWHLERGWNTKHFDLLKANTGLYFVIIQDCSSRVQTKVFIAN